MKEFWNRVRAKRIERGLTMEEVADKLGITKQAYRYRENGGLTKTRDEHVKEMALILDCEPEELLGTKDEQVYDLFKIYPKPILDWLSTEEAREYVLEAYKEWITNKMSNP